MTLKFYIKVEKVLKFKFRMFSGLISSFGEVTDEKLSEAFCDVLHPK